MDSDKVDHILHLKEEADKEWNKILSLLSEGRIGKELLLSAIIRCNTIDVDWLKTTYKNGKYFLDWKPLYDKSP